MNEESTAYERVRAAAEWLCRSQDVTGTDGSAAYYLPLWGWSAPYPETTGYIIPTLWRCADRFGREEYAVRARRMADWLLTLQSSEGWFPGGPLDPEKQPQASVFNSAQIIFGLVEAARRTGEEKYRTAAERVANWLARNQDPDGMWTLGAYHPGHRPSYYAHVAWPLAEHWRAFGGDEVRDCARKVLEAVHATRTKRGTYTHWAFEAGQASFTHTIAYTIQGMLESAWILDLRQPFADAARESAEKLMRKFELRRRLAGAYDERWKGEYGFVCLTGNCQLASAWLHLHRDTGDARYLNAAIKALEIVCAHQRLKGGLAGTRGGFAGSYPLYARYMRFRYPNWAAKFFIDAMLDLSEALESLERPADRPGDES